MGVVAWVGRFGVLVESWLNRFRWLGLTLVRGGVSLVFLYFGLVQLKSPQVYAGFLPGFAAFLPLRPVALVYLNGLFEVFFGLLLLVGWRTRLAAFLLGVHLLGITVSIGLTDIGVRDFGLAVATLSVVLSGPDRLCLEFEAPKRD